MKVIFQYFMMIGISILGILGILQLGKSLEAPPSVGGVWSVQWADLAPAISACPSVAFGEKSPKLTISQSGEELLITFPDANRTTFSGRLQGFLIDARAKHDPGLLLQATVDRQADPDQLQGTLTSSQCGTAINLTGLRQGHLPSLTGEH
jgi:hypothetical protein